MIKRATFWERPGWLFCVLLFLFHFASVKLTLFCAVTPEEFAVISQSTDAGHAQKVAAMVCEVVEELRMPHALSPHGVVTVSVGVAVTVPDAGSAADPLKQADAALYRAKQLGRNRAELAGIGLPA